MSIVCNSVDFVLRCAAKLSALVGLTLQLSGHRCKLSVGPFERVLHLFRDNFELDVDLFIFLLGLRRHEIELTESALVDHGG